MQAEFTETVKCVHCGEDAGEYRIFNNHQKKPDGAYVQDWCLGCVLKIQEKLMIIQRSGDYYLLMVKSGDGFRFATVGECKALRKKLREKEMSPKK